MKKKIILLFAILFLLSIQNNSYSMTDSLKGYGDFYFGQTKWEIEKELNGRNVKFDTTISYPMLSSFIMYQDFVEIGKFIYPMQIKLEFNQYSSFKFFRAEITTQCRNIKFEEALNWSNKIFDVLNNKYGNPSKYDDYMDSAKSIWYKPNIVVDPKTKHYRWDKSNGFVVFVINFKHFFKIDTNQTSKIYTNIIQEPDDCFLRISYIDSYLHKEFSDDNMNENKNKSIKEKEEIEKKF